MKVKSENEVAQSCPTLNDLMDCSLPGSSVHGIFLARILEWVAIAFSRQGLLSANKDSEHSGLHTLGFHIRKFNQSQIENIWGEKNFRKFQKQNLNLLDTRQLSADSLMAQW